MPDMFLRCRKIRISDMKMICTETTYGEYSANIIFDIIKADNYLTIRTGGRRSHRGIYSFSNRGEFAAEKRCGEFVKLCDACVAGNWPKNF